MRTGSSRLRIVLAVAAGYVVAALSLAAIFAIGWSITGAESLFEPDTTRATPAWMALTLLAGLLGGCAGGLVAFSVAGRPIASAALAAFLLLLGLVFAFAHSRVDDPTGMEALEGRSAEDLSAFEASAEGVAPVWFHVVMAVAQSGGVLLGARLGGAWRASHAREDS